MHSIPISVEEERIFMQEMVNSPELYAYICENSERYALFVFIPYMFGTTYYGIEAAGKKSVMIPCLHDESYAYMKVFRDRFPECGAMIFHSDPEAALAERLYNLNDVKTAVLGGGIYTDFSGVSAMFSEKYELYHPFILYAGRKDAGKNVHMLLDYFQRYKQQYNNEMKLVLIGGGEIEIPPEVENEVIDLGFIPTQDKYDAYAAATVLCQPSLNESFSLVIMESWLGRRPVLVHKDCVVTKDFVQKSNGGLYFGEYAEFASCVEYLLNYEREASIMGEQGREFVLGHFSWDSIVAKYMEFFQGLAKLNC